MDLLQEKRPKKKFGQLFLSEWYLRHKLLLERIGTILLGVVAAGLLGYSLWQWGAYLFFGYAEDQRLVEEQLETTPNYEALQAVYGAQDIELTSPRVFRGSPGMYDFVATAANPNIRHIAYLRYRFTFPGGETPVVETFLLPGERRPIAVFGVALSVPPAAVRLEFVEENYRRIDPHEIFDVAGYMNERLRFRGEKLQLSDPSRIVFDLVNDSAYSYWQPVFYIELLSGGQTAGIAYLSVDQFRAGEVRPIDVRLFGDIRGITDIRISPVLNVFDFTAYMSPGE
jgi:hypothetical protein